jgi:flagellar motility protein MotE (MotC chaperone)
MKKLLVVGLTVAVLLAAVLGQGPLGAAEEEENPPGSVEERRLRLALQEEIARTRQQEEALRLKEIELKTLELEVDKKLAALKTAQQELAQLLTQKNEAESKKIKELSQIYEKMEPAKAAALLVALDEKLAIGILGGIKKKTAGKILNEIEKDKGATLTKSYSILQ